MCVKMFFLNNNFEIKDYFPAKLNTILILRPQSYFQRVLSTIFFQEDSFNNTNTTTNNNNNNSSSLSTTTTSSNSKNNLNVNLIIFF
jgi:hypothetical protein